MHGGNFDRHELGHVKSVASTLECGIWVLQQWRSFYVNCRPATFLEFVSSELRISFAILSSFFQFPLLLKELRNYLARGLGNK